MCVEAVEPLRHRQRGDTQVGQLRPDLAAGGGVTAGPGTHGARHIGCRECRIDTGREIALLRVKVKIHSISLSGFPGQP